MARILQRQLRAITLAALLLASFAHAQTSTSQTVLDILQQMSGQAAVIFTGRVTAIRPGAENSSIVEIDFLIDQPILGCTAGSYTLREWAGLWTVDSQRYRVGQRLLMLLHAPNTAGISSPVGGLDGAIPIRQGGTASLTANTPPPPPFVDLRWLGAKLPRVIAYRSEPAHAVAKLASASTQTLASTATVSATPIANTNPSTASVPAQQASVEAIINMIATWQKAQHVAP